MYQKHPPPTLNTHRKVQIRITAQRTRIRRPDRTRRIVRRADHARARLVARHNTQAVRLERGEALVAAEGVVQRRREAVVELVVGAALLPRDHERGAGAADGLREDARGPERLRRRGRVAAGCGHEDGEGAVVVD